MGSDRGDRGQATVELALILPVLVVGAVVLVHLGLTIRLQLAAEHAARMAARAAAVEPERARVVASRAVSRVDADLRLESVTVTGEFVEVRVAGSSPPLAFLPGVGDRTLRASLVMRREDSVP